MGNSALILTSLRSCRLNNLQQRRLRHTVQMGLLRSPRPDPVRLSSPAEPVVAVAAHICRAPIYKSTIQPSQQCVPSLRNRAVA